MVDADPLVSRSTDAAPISEAAGSEDWPARAAATIEQYVGTVREKTTGPALLASRNIVYFGAIALIGLIVAVLFLVLFVRLLVTATSYVPGVEEGETWLAYLIIGALFLIGGMLLWRKKEPR